MKRGLWTVGLILLLTACSRPVTVESIPVPPGASPLIRGDLDPLTLQMVDALEEPVRNAVEEATVSSRSYSLPKRTSVDALLAFYTEALKGSDWRYNDRLTRLENDERKYYARLAYQRGQGSTEQVLLLDLLRNPTAQKPALLVILITER